MHRWTVALILLGVLLIPAVHNHQAFADHGSDRFSATKSGCGACLLDLRNAVVSAAQSPTLPHSYAELTASDDVFTLLTLASFLSSRAPPSL